MRINNMRSYSLSQWTKIPNNTVMDVLEEENPLQIETKAMTKISSKVKNNGGRPTKKDEILFSSPPQSIISLMLSAGNDKKIQEKQHKTNISQEKTVKSVEKWICEYCSERIFYKKSEYKKHLQLHKIHKCDYPKCSYSTKFISNLTTHKRVHKPDYPYVCDECTFRSKFINSLKTHKRLHKSDRPFACQHCEYRCNSGSNLKKHCIRKHSK